MSRDPIHPNRSTLGSADCNTLWTKICDGIRGAIRGADGHTAQHGAWAWWQPGCRPEDSHLVLRLLPARVPGPKGVAKDSVDETSVVEKRDGIDEDAGGDSVEDALAQL